MRKKSHGYGRKRWRAAFFRWPCISAEGTMVAFVLFSFAPAWSRRAGAPFACTAFALGPKIRFFAAKVRILVRPRRLLHPRRQEFQIEQIDRWPRSRH